MNVTVNPSAKITTAISSSWRHKSNSNIHNRANKTVTPKPIHMS